MCARWELKSAVEKKLNSKVVLDSVFLVVWEADKPPFFILVLYKNS